ncbi:hypothetical protein K435DRAFT_800574 [Dendrothele bispora CBS 962.96]|uniref:Ubiquitin-like protease family profile domain-containing protein n=1 Tax=Dendrothele bispora (strain CBS 962.96) TaxID=1314807 RepID=A0A4S8LS59_DENBC|nr:hypothetical protein K435DRAFT_800574 [Dendrothele bispora CBS 962.96]
MLMEGDVDPFQGKLDVDEPDEEDGQSAGDPDLQVESPLSVRVSPGRPSNTVPMQPYRSKQRLPPIFQSRPGPKSERLHKLSLMKKGPLHWKKLEQLILPTGSDHKKGWKNELLCLVDRKKLPWGDLDLMKRMLVPIHRPNHWIMAVADFEEELIAVYDSLCGNSEYDDIFKVFKTWISAGVDGRSKDHAISPNFSSNLNQWRLEPRPQTMERSRIGDILIQQIIPVLRAQIFSVIRKGAKEEEIDSEDYSRKMTPEEKRRSQRLKGTKEPALKHSTKYDHLPAQKWGAGSYVLVPVSSDPVSEAEESG